MLFGRCLNVQTVERQYSWCGGLLIGTRFSEDDSAAQRKRTVLHSSRWFRTSGLSLGNQYCFFEGRFSGCLPLGLGLLSLPLCATVMTLSRCTGITRNNHREGGSGRLCPCRFIRSGRRDHALTAEHAASAGDPQTNRKGEGESKKFCRVMQHRWCKFSVSPMKLSSANPRFLYLRMWP
jgi:hypothetical protein